jgi:RNA polymerase sigma-70 factor (ECF subfamily)
VLQLLRVEHQARGRIKQFDALRGLLTVGHNPRSQAEIAEELGTTEGAVKQMVHQLRQRYRELLREEVGHTVAIMGDVDDEVRYLVDVLRG